MRSPPEVRLGFAFTARDTPELRARIVRDLGHVARRAAHADPHLAALLLTGGFSRGEGSALDGVPLNDYDLIAVRNVPGGGAAYRALAHELTSEVGLEVDLMPIWSARLPRVGRKLFWLDARLGGRIVAGDETLLERIPRFGPEELHPVEAARLLGNRAAGLLIALPGAGETPDARLRDLQATKAVLAAMDATLLRERRYAATMRERLAMTAGHRDHAAFATAVRWKLDPTASLPARWWEDARDVLLRAVEATGARHATDGAVEHALHLAKARRLARSPSQAVRRAAWDILALSTYPDGPAHVPTAAKLLAPLGVRLQDPAWAAVKRGFFDARARTLQ